jgi:adenylosuccinate synthase
VAVAYRIDGEVTQDWPMTQTQVHHAEPVYEQFEGWREDISGVTRLEDLPRAARVYVDAVEKLGGVPVTAVGVGPGREQTLLRTTSSDGGLPGAQVAEGDSPRMRRE